jgi:hypothetical protein
MVERYSKKHVVAQIHSINGLCGIFKFLEILGSTMYAMFLRQLADISDTSPTTPKLQMDDCAASFVPGLLK